MLTQIGIPDKARFLRIEEFSSLQLIYKFFYDKLQSDPHILNEYNFGIMAYVDKFLLLHIDSLELDKGGELSS